MLPPQIRLPLGSNQQLQGARRNGKSLTLVCRPNNKNTPRLAIVVSKKTARLATDRNRIKRRLRSLIVQNPPTKKLDCVIIARPSIVKTEWKALEQEFKQLVLSL